MRKRRRWFVVVALLALLVGAFLAYAWLTSPARWVPGTYTTASLDNKGTVTLQLDPDGTATWDDVPNDVQKPPTQTLGRWRLSGRVIFFETGPAATAPVGFLQSLTERFDSPLLMPDTMRARVAQANARGLTLDLGGVAWTLQRMP